MSPKKVKEINDTKSRSSVTLLAITHSLFNDQGVAIKVFTEHCEEENHCRAAICTWGIREIPGGKRGKCSWGPFINGQF